jgi:tRNA threonylcarbamoyladenosine biosynthesis protein TsaB
MSILLAIETSAAEYRIALGRDRELVFDSVHPSRDIADVISGGLKNAGAKVSDISAITLNIGPGGLSYVRSGVSFANALSFSLGISIYPFSTFEILGREACKHTTLPLLCVIPAANNNAYVAVVNGTAIKVMRFGPLPSALAQAINGLPEVAIAGRNRGRVSSLLREVKVVDTHIETPDVRVLLEMGYWALDRARTPVQQAIPLTEQAEAFYE